MWWCMMQVVWVCAVKRHITVHRLWVCHLTTVRLSMLSVESIVQCSYVKMDHCYAVEVTGLSVCQSVSLSVCLSVCLSMSVCLFVGPSVCLSVRPSALQWLSLCIMTDTSFFSLWARHSDAARPSLAAVSRTHRFYAGFAHLPMPAWSGATSG